MKNIRDVNKQYRSYKNLKILGHGSTEIKPIILNWDAMGPVTCLKKSRL